MDRAEVADRAAVSPELVDRLCALGIVEEGSDGLPPAAVNVVRVMGAFEAAGMPLDAIAAGIAAGVLDYTDAPEYFVEPAAFAGTYGELARDLGWDVDALGRLVGAFGLPRPEPDERVRTDEATLLRRFLDAWRTPTGDELVGLARMYGQNLRRVAESEVAFFYDSVSRRLRSEELPPEEQAARIQREAQAAAVVAKELVHWLHLHHFETTLVEAFTLETERFLAEQGLTQARPARPPAIAFLDLTGYTRLTEERGDEEAAELAARAAIAVEDAAREHGGRAVKWLGDGVMFHFGEPARGLAAALELVERVRALGLPPARVGLNAGPVVFRDGDYFGRTVNVAARIADYARPREVLVSRELVEAVGPAPAAELEPIGEIPLKGVPTPVALFRAR